MTIKVLRRTILASIAAACTGIVYWLFPIIGDVHLQLTGTPLADPRPGYQHQLESWLNLLAANTINRTLFATTLLMVYIVISTCASLLALRARRRRRDRVWQANGRLRTLYFYNRRRIVETATRPSPYATLRDIPIKGVTTQGRSS